MGRALRALGSSRSRLITPSLSISSDGFNLVKSISMTPHIPPASCCGRTSRSESALDSAPHRPRDETRSDMRVKKAAHPFEGQILIGVPRHRVEYGTARLGRMLRSQAFPSDGWGGRKFRIPASDGLFCPPLFEGDGRRWSDLVSAREAGVGAVP